MSVRRQALLCLAVAFCLTSTVEGEVLAKGDRLAIVGDSITQQKKYSKFIETYLAVCRPDLDAHVMQFGWSGETAKGFVTRMERDVVLWKPDVVTLCYGMNDGGWRAYQDWIGEEYQTSMRAIVRRLHEVGATVVVGSPGVVDTHTFRWSPPAVNDKLAKLGEIAEHIADQENMPFADVHVAMAESMERAKAALGEAYHVAGADGVHPAVNGHLVMAYAFLKALGMDGEIGTIFCDWEGDTRATRGHDVLTAKAGRIELRSSRYPFCFQGKPDEPGGTVSILPYVSFQDELNRFMLVATNLPTARAEVSWGRHGAMFTREELADGINLAAAFLENPFRRPFETVMKVVAKKQAFETYWVWGKFRPTHFRLLKGGRASTPEEKARLRAQLTERQAEHARQVRASVKPVRHTITITPID